MEVHNQGSSEEEQGEFEVDLELSGSEEELEEPEEIDNEGEEMNSTKLPKLLGSENIIIWHDICVMYLEMIPENASEAVLKAAKMKIVNSVHEKISGKAFAGISVLDKSIDEILEHLKERYHTSMTRNASYLFYNRKKKFHETTLQYGEDLTKLAYQVDPHMKEDEIKRTFIEGLPIDVRSLISGITYNLSLEDSIVVAQEMLQDERRGLLRNSGGRNAGFSGAGRSGPAGGAGRSSFAGGSGSGSGAGGIS